MRNSPLWIAPLLLALAACPSPPRTPAAAPEQPPETPPAAEAPAADPPAPTLRLDPELASPIGYDAELTLDPAKKEFDGNITIAVRLGRETRYLWLNATELEVEEAVAAAPGGGDPRPARLLSTGGEQFVGFELPEGRRSGEIALSIQYRGKLGDDKDFDGAFVQSEGGERYLYTQFQPAGARQVFPCFDQPEFKVPWTLHVTAPSGQLAFANTPETGRRDNQDGTTTFDFAPSKPMPSYLVTVAVGPFEIVDLGTGGRAETPMRIIVPRGRSGDTGYAAREMKDVLTRLEDYFDLAYPYAKLDSIALPHFFGAMEHPGLITYASSILLTSSGEVSQSWEEVHLRVVAHELAHQWFGNLVTLRWWDDLWLNESFAEWMAQKVVGQKRPDFDPEIGRVRARESAMSGDALESAAKIRQEIRSEKDFFSAIGSIIYQKGASMISMFEAWIGEDALRRGMRSYMRAHSWKTATSDDFFTALAAVSDPGLPEAFATFIDQTGFPVIEMKLDCDGDRPALELGQRKYTPDGSGDGGGEQWKLPVCVKYGVGGKSHTSCRLMTERRMSFPLEKATRCPAWVLGNAESAGYYRVLHGGPLLSRLLAASRRLSPADRVGLIADVDALMGSGQVDVGTALGLIPRARRDKSPYVVMSAAGIASQIRELATGKLEARYRRFVRKMFAARARQLGWKPGKGESREVRELRSELVPLVAIEGGDRKLLAGAAGLAETWLEDPSAIDSDMLGPTLRAAAKVGDAALYDRLLAAVEETRPGDKRSAILAALGSFEQPELTERTLQLVLHDRITFRDYFSLFQEVSGDPDRRERSYEFVKSNYDAISAKMPAMARGFLAFAAVPFCDEEHKADAKEFFAPRFADVPNGERTLAQATDLIDVCIARRARQRPGVAKFLRRY